MGIPNESFSRPVGSEDCPGLLAMISQYDLVHRNKPINASL